MDNRSLKTFLMAVIVAGIGVVAASADARAQGKSDVPRKSPGATCSHLAPNSQAHKTCIQKQAKMGKIAKPAKPVAPTRPGAKPLKKS